MAKISKNLFAFLFALFAFQGAMAQNVIYQEDFSTSLGEFTIEGFNGDNNNIWQWDSYYKHAVADGYGKFIGNPLENYLVSPEITLSTGNQVSFAYSGQWFTDMKNETGVFVREGAGAEWVKLPLDFTIDGSSPQNTGDIDIPAEYDNKTVQFGFRYSSKQSNTSGILHIKDFVVKGASGASSEKVDPALAYDVTEMTYTMGDAFTAPVLANPNNVAVTYSSSDLAVATIDEMGIVTVLGEGVTTIKAVSAETDEYLAGEASYVLTVNAQGGGSAAAEVLFEETFASNLGNFTQENADGSESSCWQWFFITQSAYAVADMFMDSRLVSPEIMLATQNTAAFSYRAGDFADLATEVKFSVREVGGEWTDLDLPVLNNDLLWQDVVIEIPADFDNKNVQVAFRIVSSYGTICVKNLVVSGIKGDAPAEKADPAISFNVGDVEAVLGQAFEAPVLNNPNNVEIVYSSYNPEVATVDPQTGAVTLVGEGFTTITATSVENDQFKSAFVNYVLTVKPAAAADIIFEENFETSLGEFVVEGFNGQESNPIWMNTSGYAKADGYYKISEETTNYLVSPVIKLDAVGNEAEFTYYFTNYDMDNEIKNQIGFCVRTVGGEWEEIELPTYANGEVKCIMTVPGAYVGKEVQFGFRYTARSSMLASVWNVDNLIVRKGAAAPVEKKDPEISFAEETHNFYFNTSSFAGVELINPNNVEVVYSIENNDYSVADVEPSTGMVWIYDYGTVVITATSVETDEFKEGKASYTLVVSDIPTGIEGITADDLENGKVYDLQGRRVNKLGKGVFIVNGKKVVIK